MLPTVTSLEGNTIQMKAQSFFTQRVMCRLLCLLMFVSSLHMINAIPCGFPGRPAYGRALQVADSYSEGQAVTYTCNNGYYMVGTVIRRCLPNGTWTGYIPVCDTTLSPVGFTSSSEPLPLYPSELAIDSNKKTCFYSNRRKPRWWRMDMGVVQTVISVAITVPFASSEHHFTIFVIEVNDTNTKYHKCASFRGIFSSQTMILSCGNMKGIIGSVLHIEDDSPHLDHFGICEVEVFVRKDYYECGQPEVPTNSFIVDKPNNMVNYECKEGYKLEGSRQRTCMRNGQWTGSQAICRQINCSKPNVVENGYFRLINSPNDDKPTLGSRVIYSCKPGFYLVGSNDTQYCTENGVWTGTPPQCHPIDCGPPSENIDYLGGRFQLLNRSTKFMASAELICFNGKRPGIIIQCKDDGTWTDMDATCIFNKVNIYNANTSYSHSAKHDSNILTIGLVSAVMVVVLVLLLLIFLLFKKKILQFKWASEPMSTSRRPSWRALELLRSTNINFRKPFTLQTNCSTKKQSIPSKSSMNSSNFENDYEEITNINTNPITDETEDKIRRAAIIAAELAAINEQKQIHSIYQSNSLKKPSTPPLGIYAKVDLIQKHKDRLLREKKLTDIKCSEEFMECSESGIAINFLNRRVRVTDSMPEFDRQSSPGYESIKSSSFDLGHNQTHLLKDNMIFVGHPGVGVTNCDHLSQVTQSGTTSDLKRVYTIST